MNILILGAGGFIGSHLCKRLHTEGHTVTGVDIKLPEYWDTKSICTYFVQDDLRTCNIEKLLFTFGPIDELYQLAADMGGAGYIFTGEHDADVMHNSAMINLNVAIAAVKGKVGRLFYSSSACMYPAYNQTDPSNPNCEESSAYPAAPDSEYGWEKLFSERMYKAFERNYGLQIRIARFHNIFGTHGTWDGDRAKAPAAICRKVAKIAPYLDGALLVNDFIEIWGDGTATRSFLWIDECVEGILRLMRSDCTDIVNIGSEEIISINNLAQMIIDISGKTLAINNIIGPTGVQGRNSHNKLIQEKLKWSPSQPLRTGIEKLYEWINSQVETAKH